MHLLTMPRYRRHSDKGQMAPTVETQTLTVAAGKGGLIPTKDHPEGAIKLMHNETVSSQAL